MVAAGGCYHPVVMVRFSAVLGMLCVSLIAACDDYYDTEGEIVGALCETQRIEQLRPRNDDGAAYVDGYVFATLACPARNSTLTVRKLDETPAQGLVNLHHGDRQIRFHPSPPLQTDTTYEVRMDTTDGFREWRFRTSEVGNPTGSDIAGVAMALLPAQGALLDPPGLTEMLLTAFEDLHPVVQFMGNGIEGLAPVRLGGYMPDAEGDPQDPSQPVIDGNANWDDPFFRFGPADVAWELPGWTLLIEDAVWSGAIAPDRLGGGGGAVQGNWDTRLADDALGGGPGSLCAISASAGDVPCVACSDGALACLPLHLVHVPANPWYGTLEAPVAE